MLFTRFIINLCMLLALKHPLLLAVCRLVNPFYKTGFYWTGHHLLSDKVYATAYHQLVGIKVWSHGTQSELSPCVTHMSLTMGSFVFIGMHGCTQSSVSFQRFSFSQRATSGGNIAGIFSCINVFHGLEKEKALHLLPNKNVLHRDQFVQIFFWLFYMQRT